MRNNIKRGIITSIMSSIEEIDIIKTSGNLRTNYHSQLGIPLYQFYDNPYLPEYKSVLLKNIKNCIISDTLVINSDILNNKKILLAIQSKIETENLNVNIRITDKEYILTKEDYDKLSFANTIIVDNCTEELDNCNNILLQYGIFKYELNNFTQPVIERRKRFNELVTRDIFHINHPLSEEELELIANYLNKIESSSIELDYYDSNYYEEFLKGLQRYNVKENINIQLIGYLLKDQLEVYKSLKKYPYEIDIIYSTCHDIVNKYQNEPYTENRFYYSQIEGGGKTSLNNYINLIEQITDFEEKAKGLSPLEIAILAKITIDNMHIYDPDSDDIERWNNISKIINNEEDDNPKTICISFSTLYSTMLRRIGIPMFRYSTTGHSRNIGRINDDKYKVNTICTCDVKWDLQSLNHNIPNYLNFMLSPREYIRSTDANEYEEMTIADVFALTVEDYEQNYPNANLYCEKFYHPIGYEPIIYILEILELIDNTSSKKMTINPYDKIYHLCKERHIEGIPKDKVLRAINKVLYHLGFSKQTVSWYHSCAEISFEVRSQIFDKPPAIGGNNRSEIYPVNILTLENIDMYHQKLQKDKHIYYRKIPSYYVLEVLNQEKLSESSIHKPRARSPKETDGKYAEFLRQYYKSLVQKYRYLESLVQHINNNNLTLYEYYIDVANHYRSHKGYKLLQFERGNPFIKDGDLYLVLETDDKKIPLQFADTLSKVIDIELLVYKITTEYNQYKIE